MINYDILDSFFSMHINVKTYSLNIFDAHRVPTAKYSLTGMPTVAEVELLKSKLGRMVYVDHTMVKGVFRLNEVCIYSFCVDIFLEEL